MRYQHLLLIFFLIAAAVMMPIFVNTDLLTKTENINQEYSRYLITATEGCLAAAKAEEPGESYIFKNEYIRNKAVDTFYDTLIGCFNFEYSTYENLVHYYVPCVFLIDTDGYYIEYTDTYVNDSGEYIYTQVITPINKWAQSHTMSNGDVYTVEYRLDDTVKVIRQLRNGETDTFEGLYNEVYAKIGRPDDMILGYDKDKFRTEKTDYIINCLQNELEYYVNNNQGYINRTDTQYQFTIPREHNYWARLIDNPTVISFLQGNQSVETSNFLNIYAFAGSELENQKFYYTQYDGETLFYHTEKCAKITDIENKQKYTMHEAAEHGAYPCPDCIY